MTHPQTTKSKSMKQNNIKIDLLTCPWETEEEGGVIPNEMQSRIEKMVQQRPCYRRTKSVLVAR